MKPKKIFYLASTHWDREWYRTFQQFRFRLVPLMNSVLDVLENDPTFTHYMLDGQTCLINDYLEVAPENRERFEKLLKQKRLLAGPWFTMPDAYSVSGESIIANLSMGHKKAGEFGAEALKHGYICDIFGSPANLPQIFNGFGIHSALFSRGRNDFDTPSFFEWQSQDGSTVTAYKTDERLGYGTFYNEVIAKYQNDGNFEELKRRAVKYTEEELERTKLPFAVLMDGMDHEGIHPYAPEIARHLEHHFGCPVVFGSPDLFFNELKTHGLNTVKGELYKTGKRVVEHLKLIPNSVSARYDLKHKNALCERSLERYAYPLSALSALYNKPINENYFNVAYKYLLLNHAHDSICGCSLDEVHEDMHYRFRQAEQISDEITKESCKNIFELADSGGDLYLTLINPLPKKREEVFDAFIDFPIDYPHKYQNQSPAERINAFKLVDGQGCEVRYQLKKIERNLYTEAWTCLYKKKVDRYHINIQAAVPAQGAVHFRIEGSDVPVRNLKKMSGETCRAENEFLTLSVNADGTINIYDKQTGRNYENLMYYTDDGEIGDGWFHVAPSGGSTFFSIGSPVTIERTAHGEFETAFRITVRMEVSKNADAMRACRSNETDTLKIVSTISLRKGERHIRVKTAVDNSILFHRLKVNFPTRIDSGSYYSGQALDFVKRETGCDVSTEKWLEADRPEKGFDGCAYVSDKSGGFAFVSDCGVKEISAYSGGDGVLAVTLLRCFSNTFFGNPSFDKTDKGQLTGISEYEYALMPLSPIEDACTVAEQKNLLGSPLCFTHESATPPKTVSGIELTGKAVYSIIMPGGPDSLYLRVFNPSESVIDFNINAERGIKSVYSCNLLLEKQEKVKTFGIKPHELKTYLINLK